MQYNMQTSALLFTQKDQTQEKVSFQQQLLTNFSKCKLQTKFKDKISFNILL